MNGTGSFIFWLKFYKKNVLFHAEVATDLQHIATIVPCNIKE